MAASHEVSVSKQLQLARTRPRLTTLKKGSQLIGVPYNTVREAGLRGEFPLVRIGRALYADWTELDRWIERHTERAS